MHTGALRYLYDKSSKVAYTWRIHFDDSFPSQYEHYTLTVEDSAYQPDLLAAVNGRVDAVKALDVRLTMFAGDVLRVAEAYTTAMRADPTLRARCESVYPGIRVQPIR
jgi:hypothetical protein